MSGFPKVTFGIIVFNGEPFTRYCLRAIYPFAHEIIVVEGAVKSAASLATPDGHSTDGTLDTLYRFKEEEDPENKLQIVIRNGFWEEKDEQSRAYAERATGDYLWQVDIDEFYKPQDIQTIIRMLAHDPSISGVSFHLKNFWGGFDYLVDGWEYRDLVKKMKGIRRIFRWGKGYRYVSHRPPTIVDAQGRDLCTLNWIGPNETAKMGVFCYHYGMVFPKQARQKTIYYQGMWENHKDMPYWYHESYVKLRRPLRILHGTKPPSWLYRFKGTHPPAIRKLIEDCKKKDVTTVEERWTEDIEQLLDSRSYQILTSFLSLSYYIVAPLRDMFYRIKTSMRRLFKKCTKTGRAILRRVLLPPLESLPNCPDLFKIYRYLNQHPALKRVPGGWAYKGKFYPDYLTVGGAACAIFRVALRYCKGKGVDIGAGYWPLPGAIPVDTERGPGVGRVISDFEDDSLDFIFSSHCLEHIENWRSALAEWVKKVKPGGVVFLYLPHPECEIWHPNSPFVGDGHKWVPTPKIVFETLKELGCHIVDRDEGPDAMMSFYVCARKHGKL